MAKIILIENDRYVPLLCPEQLTEDGHRVVPALDAESALDICGLVRPDIIMEHLSPDDDLAFVQDIQKLNGKAPIILHTGHPLHEHLTNLAAAALVRRSSNLRELRATVAGILTAPAPTDRWGCRPRPVLLRCGRARLF